MSEDSAADAEDEVRRLREVSRDLGLRERLAPEDFAIDLGVPRPRPSGRTRLMRALRRRFLGHHRG